MKLHYSSPMKNPSSETQELIWNAKSDLATQLHEVITVPGKTAEQLTQDIRHAIEFITDHFHVEPNTPLEGLVLAARRSFAIQVSSLLTGDDSAEQKLKKIQLFIGEHIQTSVKKPDLPQEDTFMMEIEVRQEAGADLSPAEVVYLEARQAGFNQEMADLMAWQAIAPSALKPEEAAYVEYMRLGYGDKAASIMAKKVAQWSWVMEEAHSQELPDSKGAFRAK